MTERRSMMAERDTTDRYLAAYLADRVGSEFAGAIAGVARFGLFVKLDETGADGLVPISSLGREYFAYDPDAQTLTGETSRRVLGLGQRVLGAPRRGGADHRRPALRAARGRGPQAADPAAPGAARARRAASSRARAPARRPGGASRPGHPFFSTRRPSSSAICTAFSAAPLRRLSETTHIDSPLSIVGSCRMRLT